MLGFDGKVGIRIKEEYGAEKIILINGFPAYLPKFEKEGESWKYQLEFAT